MEASMITFQQFDINNNILQGLDKLTLKNPTPIQEKTFSIIQKHKDLIACSQTGSGKTMAYLVPLINMFTTNSENNKDIQVIILTPTQDLSAQIAGEIDKLCQSSHIDLKSLLLVNTNNINRQIEAIRHSKPSIIVCTPKRLVKLIKLKKIKVHNVKTLVLDEADKLLDKNNLEDVLFIRKSLMKRIQVLLFSASIQNKTIKTANLITFKPVIINLTKEQHELIPRTIKHIYFIVDRNQRIEMLRKIIKADKSNKTLIFVNTKYDLKETLQKLKYHHYNVDSIAGNIDNQVKKKIITDFKSGKIEYLLATDVAARGLQIDDISTVIHLNLPEEPIEYQHRAGRCGRNGNSGLCISIITENELSKIKKLQKAFHINFVQKKLYQGKIVAK